MPPKRWVSAKNMGLDTLIVLAPLECISPGMPTGRTSLRRRPSSLPHWRPFHRYDRGVRKSRRLLPTTRWLGKLVSCAPCGRPTDCLASIRTNASIIRMAGPHLSVATVPVMQTAVSPRYLVPMTLSCLNPMPSLPAAYPPGTDVISRCIPVAMLDSDGSTSLLRADVVMGGCRRNSHVQ